MPCRSLKNSFAARRQGKLSQGSVRNESYPLTGSLTAEQQQLADQPHGEDPTFAVRNDTLPFRAAATRSPVGNPLRKFVKTPWKESIQPVLPSGTFHQKVSASLTFYFFDIFIARAWARALENSKQRFGLISR